MRMHLMRRGRRRRFLILVGALTGLYILYRLSLGSDDSLSMIDVDVPDLDTTGIVHNHHNFFNLIDNTVICGSGRRQVFLLVLVSSHPSHVERRQRIRETYGAMGAWGSRAVRVAFILAVIPEDETLQPRVYEESSKWSDIIQEEFPDDRLHAARKTMMGFKWAAVRCANARFILRIDDDVLPNPSAIVERLTAQFGEGKENAAANEADSLMLYCSPSVARTPVRLASDRWYSSVDEYPQSEYPEHCEPGAYFVSSELAKRLFAAYRRSPYFWIEHVFVTGLLREALTNVHMVPFGEEWGFAVLGSLVDTNVDVPRNMFFRAAHDDDVGSAGRDWFSVWKLIGRHVTSARLPLG